MLGNCWISTISRVPALFTQKKTYIKFRLCRENHWNQTQTLNRNDMTDWLLSMQCPFYMQKISLHRLWIVLWPFDYCHKCVYSEYFSSFLMQFIWDSIYKFLLSFQETNNHHKIGFLSLIELCDFVTVSVAFQQFVKNEAHTSRNIYQINHVVLSLTAEKWNYVFVNAATAISLSLLHRINN